MTYQVRITSRGYEDLRAIIRWWADNRSADQAAEWYEGLLAKIQSLSSMPESHPFARENPRVAFELRELHYGLGSGTTHRALFRIVGTTVEVLSVRHVAQADINPDDLG